MLRFCQPIGLRALRTSAMRSQPMYASVSVRGLHASVPLFQAVKRDADAETGLFYHDLGHGNWAISLLERAPKSPKSLSVIGHIQPGDKNPSEFVRENPDNVNMNEDFWNALHHVLQGQIASDENLIFEAEMRENGWAHLCGTYCDLHRCASYGHARSHFATRGHFRERGIHRFQAGSGLVRAQRHVPLCCEA